MSPETTTKTKTKTKKKTKKKKKKKTKTKVEKQLLKEKFIRLVRRKLIENATFRRAFVNANEYNKIAQSVRVAFREDDDDDDDEEEEDEKEKMLHFLDSKSHFLFVVDKVVGQKSEDDDEDVHVNLTEPLETWLRVKNYHRNKFKKLGENAAATIKEKQKAKREAKERVNKARMEKKEKETKEKERKERKRKYHVDLEYYRHKGTCLDWVNTGTCRFGSECTYAHDEEAKGKLIEAAREVEAKTGRERGLRGEYADAKQKKRKREDALLGDFDDFDDDDDDNDDDKDDIIVPGFLKAQMKKSSKARKDDEEERPTLSIRERKLLEKKMKTNANTNGKKNKKFDKTKRVVGRKTPTNNTTKANGVAVTKKKKKERHPDGRHAKRSRARLEQIQ